MKKKAKLIEDVLNGVWRKILDSETHHDLLRRGIPVLSSPEKIRFSVRAGSVPESFNITVKNLLSSVSSPDDIPKTKRFFIRWMRNIFEGVRIVDDLDDSISFMVDARDRLPIFESYDLNEVAVSVYRRNGKGGLVMKYKCLAGRKKGRTVSDPSMCNKVPDIRKRETMRMNLRKMHGSANVKKKITRLNDVSYKRMRRANKRLAKSRGY